MITEIISPAKCSTDVLADVAKLILSGRQVVSSGLGNRIGAAEKLLLVWDDKSLCRLVGVVALKHPEQSYIERVLTGRGGGVTDALKDDGIDPVSLLEVGWMSISSDAAPNVLVRNRGRVLSLWDNEHVFFTTANLKLARIGEQLGFKKYAEFEGREGRTLWAYAR